MGLCKGFSLNFKTEIQLTEIILHKRSVFTKKNCEVVLKKANYVFPNPLDVQRKQE